MSAAAQVDYDSLAQKHGANPSSVDYDALAQKHGASPQQEQPTQNRMGPDNRGLLQRANDWWTRQTAPFEGTLDNPGRSPQQKATDLGKGVGVASLPLIGGGLATAPVATALGMAGGTVGNYLGKKLGGYLGGKVGAPDLGEDVGGITGTLAGGAGGGKLGGVIDSSFANARTASLPERATDVYHRGVRPGSTNAADEAVMRENFQRSAKYIAPETRAMAVEGGPGGALRAADVADQAADRLWKRAVDPAIKTYANVQGDARPVAQQIRESFTGLDKATDQSKIAAAEKVAQFFDRPMTVKEMSDTVTELNNNKSVSRYYNMSDAERTSAELGDPALRAKVTALNGLRQRLIDTVGEAGGDKVGQSFQEARKDWGALRSVANQIRDTNIPAPEGMATRAANTLRGIYRPEYWATRETLGMLNSPNRLIPKSLNMLGRSDLFPPEAPPLTTGVGDDAEFYDLPPRRPLLGTSPLPSTIPMERSTLGADEFRTGAPTSAIVPQDTRLGLPEPQQIQLGRVENQPPQGLLDAAKSVQRDPRTGKMKRVYLGTPQ